MKLTILILCSVVLSCYAVPRVKDPLSEHEHFKKEGDHEHDPEYDHDAFIGKDIAKEYDELSPEQSKEKLGKLFHKVDADGDNLVTEDELKKWIKKTQNRYIQEDTDTQMKHMDTDKDGSVSWDEYHKNTYGDMAKDEDDEESKKMVARDEKRFKKADAAGTVDMKLNSEELAAFLHPESHDYMKGYIAEETFEDIDKNGDGSVSMEEYMSDMYPAEDHAGETEPEWVASERKMFSDDRDKNKDGKLDVEEVRQWIMPDESSDMEGGIDSEAQHLIKESDTNNDGKISKEEMVEKYDVFVGSQATDYGEMFKSHTEL